jgi:hypothetical protein
VRVRARWLALGLAAILLLALGVAIGRRAPEPEPKAAQPAETVTVTVAAPEIGQSEAAAPDEAEPGRYGRTPKGAVAAATAYVAALGAPAILEPAAVRETLTAIAASGSRDDLVRAYEQAATQARERLGTGSTFIRTVPVGFRVDGFQPNAATISIWRVGIVGSGGTVEPRQSWRTETLSLVWQDATWKLDAVRSSQGPTPPLARAGASPPAELYAAIPEFQEFGRAVP